MSPTPVPSTPRGWAFGALSDFVEQISSRVKPSDFPNDRFIGMDAVEAHTMKLLGTVPASTMKSSAVKFRPGQVLYGRLRPYLNKVLAPDFEGLASAEFICLEPKSGIHPKLIQYRLNSMDFVRFASRINEGDRPRVDFDQISTFPIQLPPHEEHASLVAALDSYFSRIDDVEAGLERVQRNLKRYRASVLQAAVTGQLVPTEAELARAEGRGFEPASKLLERILHTRRLRWLEAGLRGRYREPEAPDTSRLPTLPDGWCWSTLEQLVWLARDGPHYSPKYSESGVPFITGGNVRPEGVDFETARRISPELHEEFCKRIRPEIGDILYTKGGTTGTARVNTYGRAFSVWVHVAVLKLAGPLEPFYLQHALNSLWCFTQAQSFTHGVGNQDLGLTRMVKITIPLPPIAEQRSISSRIDLLTSKASQMQFLVDAQLARCAKLRQSTLRSAFSGELRMAGGESSCLPVEVGKSSQRNRDKGAPLTWPAEELPL